MYEAKVNQTPVDNFIHKILCFFPMSESHLNLTKNIISLSIYI